MRNRKAQLGEVFLIPLTDGRHLPFQVLAQRQKTLLSICGIIDKPVAREHAAPATCSSWTADDVVAEVTVQTAAITRHDGAPWPRLGVYAPLKQPSVHWRERSLMFKLKLLFGIDDTSSFSSIGVLYLAAHAFVGLEPWDGMADPDYYEERLTPAGRIRATRIYQKANATKA